MFLRPWRSEVSRLDGEASEFPGAGSPVIFQHPLAYLLGLEGIALLRAFAGQYDREFTLARIADIRALLDAAAELGDGVEEAPMSMREGYAQWAPWYDEPGNELLEIEEPVVREILDALPVGVALDAACGTGRHGAYLASLGHRVIGVDATPEMLDVARVKIPAESSTRPISATPARGRLGRSRRLRDRSQPRSGSRCRVRRVRARASSRGHLVLTDSRGLIGDIGLPLARTRPTGRSATSRCGAVSRVTISP